MGESWRSGHPKTEELAALLDGEISDFALAEQLKAALESDPALKAEFEEQRQIKLLLVHMADEQEAPAYISTRIMGEISARKNARRSFRLPAWGAAGGAVMLFALGYGAAVQLGAPAQPATVQADAAYPPGLFRNTTDMYETLASDTQSAFLVDEAVPADAEPWLKEFIELGHNAHTYRKAVRATSGVAGPDMPSAVLVVDPGE